MIANLENRAFILLLVLASISFIWMMAPFAAAIFWAAIVAILFSPLERMLERRFPERPNLTALLTLAASFLGLVIPMTVITLLVTGEILSAYQYLTSDQFQVQPLIDQFLARFPFVQEQLSQLELDIDAIRTRISEAMLTGGQFVARQVFQFGQGYLTFVLSGVLMVYLTFFFLRDGQSLIRLLIRALPLGDSREQRLFTKFAEVTRATVKGSLVVALVQGSIGGVAFWMLGIEGAFLWGTIMVILSLLPAVGSALIWLPVAIWLLADGDYLRGGILLVVGIVFIGLVDNILRPILVGRDTKMPDYMVLFSTLGGLSMFGLSGFVMGPVLAALFMVVWQIFMEEYHPDHPRYRPPE